MTDQQIIEEVKNGNNRIIDRLIKDNRPILKRLFLGLDIKNDDIIKDLYTETILSFIDNCKKGLNLTCKISSYLYSVGKNIALKHLNNPNVKKMTRINFERHDTRTENINSTFLNVDEKTLLLRNCISELPKNDKKLLNYVIQGFSNDEILVKMGYKNKNTLKTKKYKSLKLLKKMIDERINF